MPTFDEEIRNRIRTAAPPATTGEVFERLASRKRHRARVRKIGTIATVIVVLAGTLAAFAIVDASRNGPQPIGEPTPTPSPNELGLPYPVCDVSTMPIGIGTAQGLAAVFTQATDGCPKRLGKDAFVRVGVDLDGDDIVDATAGPIPECFTLCEAFAAPDVNGDGIAEVAVSTAGADGYGVWLYAVSISPPTIAAITEEGKQFGFAWVNVATHAESARCSSADSGQPLFVLDHAEWRAPNALLVQEVFAIEGTIATKLGREPLTMPLDEAPVPTDRLCGAPVHGSAEGAMGDAPHLDGRDIGLSTNVCDASSLRNLNLVPDAIPDTAYTGFFIDVVGRCPKDYDRQRWIVAVDVTGDDEADAYTDARLVNCAATGCTPLDATDLDADGDGELVIQTSFSILDQGYFSVSTAGGRVEIDPILVAAPGHPEAGAQPGEPLMTSAGGDAGFGSWIRCENYPAAPVLVQLLADGVVDANLPTKWHEVKFRLEADGMFHVIGATDLSLPPGSDPGLIRSTAPACGVDFNPFV